MAIDETMTNEFIKKKTAKMLSISIIAFGDRFQNFESVDEKWEY